MSPWMWLVWALAALVILYFASATVAAVVDQIRKPTPCERCGHVWGQEIVKGRLP